MGSCLSKKSSSSGPPKLSSSLVLNSFDSAPASTVVVPVQDPKPRRETPKQSPSPQPQEQQQQVLAEEHAAAAPAKKEVFLIKHRKSHDDRDRSSKVVTSSDQEEQSSDGQVIGGVSASGAAAPAQIRTSSCTKEELDAILIQCGRLSRSSSGKAASSSATAGGGRRYSGSKRSFDFDNNGVDGSSRNEITAAADDEEDEEKRARDRERQQRRSRHSPSPQGRRRRTPSREREKDNNSGSNNSNQRSSSRERRVSRSPGRRGNSTTATDSASDSVPPTTRPGKMVSVPATVTDKSNNGEAASCSVKRITVKRNVGDPAARAKTSASPRTQSPARVAGNDCQGVAPSLSRNSSRKAEISPYRRNPLSEIDPNSLSYPNRSQSRGKREIDGSDDPILVPNQSQKPNAVQRTKNTTATVETTVVTETKPQTLTKTRSSRRSRDLDFNPESLLDTTNPDSVPSYTRLLLQDIHNFHQKNTSATAAAPTPVTLPACVSKACSILEAVADLNNNGNNNNTVSPAAASSNLDHYNKTYNNLGSAAKDPFVESEIGCCDDLMEPSFHKYVTVRRGAGVGGGADAEDQESSGSNSFVGNSQISGSWGLSPSSAECWSSRSREEERSSGRKRESYSSSGGIGRGRVGSAAKGLQAGTAITTTTTVVVE